MKPPNTLLSVDEIKNRIQSLESLPPFPAMATQILMQCKKPDVEVQTVVKLIECEPAIGAKVLMVANSPLYGTSRPILTIGHAIVVLGFRSVAQMAIAMAMEEVFSQGVAELSEHRNRVFAQSLACATTARTISVRSRKANPDEAFLCGVMQDIGKLVFFDVVPSQYCDLLQQIPNGETVELEQESFGVDHPGVGKSCGAKWGLPTQINSAINDHHRMIGQIDHELSQTVIAANYFGRRWQIGFDANEVAEENEAIEQIFSSLDLNNLRDECADQFAAVREICALQ